MIVCSAQGDTEAGSEAVHASHRPWHKYTPHRPDKAQAAQPPETTFLSGEFPNTILLRWAEHEIKTNHVQKESVRSASCHIKSLLAQRQKVRDLQVSATAASCMSRGQVRNVFIGRK